MALDRDLLKSIFDEMDYDVEFDSDTPGVVVGDSFIDWKDVPTVLDLEENELDQYKIKTTKLDNVSLTYFKHGSQNKDKKTTYKRQTNSNNSLTKTWRLVA
ncbi:hypothetical protein [Tetragenococcus halophilus]|uniref:hypothetical protein n=1 Tax=Tetragenococcus halophilus TaxID=51669 RepID=UPI0015B79C11|nr:hypothetical protein [Tetragenococcus halophilus]NWO00696.1 hypothetical protein [Tetragenococcus halophilus]